MKLPRSFYMGDDVVTIAERLLGKVLVTRLPGGTTSGVITETEAYAGERDRASHAWNGRRTARTEVMYGPGGYAYVYLCYGVHHLFNVVTNQAGIPHAVLVRAVHPLDGVALMWQRRGDRRTTGGPGTLSRALGIQTAHTGTDLTGDRIWIEDRGIRVSPGQVITGPRIGVDYAGKDALLPYRFRVAPSHLSLP